MVDSCFKAFKLKSLKCFRKSSIKTLRDSRESIFQPDKNAINENIYRDKKFNFATSSAPSLDNNDKKIRNDNGESEHHSLEMETETESDVMLRRHHRLYLHSISTTTSYDAMSSDGEFDSEENLDVLYPLPGLNPHEWSLNEDDSQQNVDNKLGKVDFYTVLMRRLRIIIIVSEFTKNNSIFSSPDTRVLIRYQ